MNYFAYGSNMNWKQMAERCLGARFVSSVILNDYRLVFGGYSKTWEGPIANAVPEKGPVVHGGLWEITDGDLESLDRYEGYPKSYQRKSVRIVFFLISILTMLRLSYCWLSSRRTLSVFQRKKHQSLGGISK